VVLRLATVRVSVAGGGAQKEEVDGLNSGFDEAMSILRRLIDRRRGDRAAAERYYAEVRLNALVSTSSPSRT
jgi:hypothetical protein